MAPWNNESDCAWIVFVWKQLVTVSNCMNVCDFNISITELINAWHFHMILVANVKSKLILEATRKLKYTQGHNKLHSNEFT